MTKKVFLNSTDKACFPNRLDLNKIRKFLEKNGWGFVDDHKEADLILTGTCAYEKSFEDDSISRIIRIQNTKKPGAKFIVWGCLPKINKERLQEVFHGDFVGPDELERLNGLISAETQIQDIEDANELTEEDISTYAAYPKLFNMFKPLIRGLEKHLKLRVQPFYDYSACIYDSDTYYLRVSSGCLNRCSYCAIKNARGDLKSKPLETVLNEFRQGLKQGYKEFALVGQEVGSYGRDIKTDLVELLDQITKEQGNYKLHLLFIEPSWFVRLFPKLDSVLKSGRIASINLTVQSGSDRILRKMNRFYRIDDVMGCVRELKKLSPSVIVRTHLMVGFPGETEDDFRKTADIMDNFDLVNGLFEFSPRAGTPAATLDGQVPADVKRRRFNKLYWQSIRKALRSVKVEISRSL